MNALAKESSIVFLDQSRDRVFTTVFAALF